MKMRFSPALFLLLIACGDTMPGVADAAIASDASLQDASPAGDAGSAAIEPFLLGNEGCPMAHCNPQLTDQGAHISPTGPIEVRWHDDTASGSSFGLGCSSNGDIVACSYTGGDSLVVYERDGSIRWSTDVLGATAFASAPLVSTAGEVIAASATAVVRFAADGTVQWSTELTGLPISPVPITGTNGTPALAIATSRGPVSVVHLQTGEVLDELTFGDESAESYSTRNTPCVIGSRLFVAMQANDTSNGAGGLVAFDFDGEGLSAAWRFPFTAPSGASPVCDGDRVVFDAGGSLDAPDTPTAFSVLNGERPTLLWSQALPAAAKASLAVDPRGGYWAFGLMASSLLRLDRDTGEVAQDLSFRRFGLGYFPSSAMTITGDASRPTMLISAAQGPGDAKVLSIDLLTGAPHWETQVQGGTSTQFAIVGGDDPLVVFPARTSGARAIGNR